MDIITILLHGESMVYMEPPLQGKIHACFKATTRILYKYTVFNIVIKLYIDSMLEESLCTLYKTKGKQNGKREK